MSRSHDPFQRSNPSRRENRTSARFPSQFKTYCQAIMGDNELLWSVEVEELSQQDVKIISHRRFEPGTVLRIGLIHEKAGVLLARAVGVSPGPENDWVIECAFPKKLEDNELKSWIERDR